VVESTITAVESVTSVSTDLPPQDARIMVERIANTTKLFFIFFCVFCFLFNLRTINIRKFLEVVKFFVFFTKLFLR
jgi:hypothetical protein